MSISVTSGDEPPATTPVELTPAAAAEAAPAMPTPPTPRPRAPTSVIVIAVLLVAAVLYAAQDVVLPVLLAAFFALVGNPIIRLFRKIHLPRFLGALIVLAGGITAAGALGMQLWEPASDWFRDAPRELRQLAPKLREIAKPVQDANLAAENFARAAGGDASKRPQIVRTTQDDPYRMLVTTPKLVASILAVVLLTFFFMVYGENLQRQAIALMPSRQQKKFTVEILHSIEREVSRYVLTISLINTCVGLVFAGVLYLLKFPISEALLWGTLAALLNFAPYVGPLIGVVAMLLVGFITFDDPLQSLAPAGAYLLLHTLEGQIITPIILGRRMALSPLVLILALMVFGSAWGIIGLLLAVPLLVCVKLVLARVDGMEGWARLLE